MMDETGESDVYDVWKESAMDTCIHDPRRGVNKCMHKRDIDARWGVDEMEGKRNEPGLVHGSHEISGR
jgi:hypothetical protein